MAVINGNVENQPLIGTENEDIITGYEGTDWIQGAGGDDSINAGSGDNWLYFYPFDGHDVVSNGGGVDTLVFSDLGGGYPSYASTIYPYFGGENDDNLYISYGWNGDLVTVENYKLGGHSVQNIQLGTSGPTYSLGSFIRVGTDGNDVLYASGNNEAFAIYKGNDTIIFSGDCGINSVWSTPAYDELGNINYDTLVFTDSLFSTDTIDFNYEQDWDPEIGITNNLKITAYPYNDDYDYTTVIYKDFLTGNTPNLLVVDASGNSVQVRNFNTTFEEDWRGDWTTNHAVFLQGSSDQSQNVVISNGAYNYINTNGGRGLNYTYEGGRDQVFSQSLTADDNYHIASFNTSTSLLVVEGGGNDEMWINANASDIRLMFNVSADGSDLYDSDLLIHKDCFNINTLYNYYGDDAWTGGVIQLANASENNTPIESLKTNDYQVALDYTKWKSVIANDVRNWLQQKGYNYSYEVFINGFASGNFNDIYELLGIYNRPYEDVVLKGTDGDDTLNGSERTDVLQGFGGNDILNGNGGDDHIEGGTGDDTLNGGLGSNFMYFYKGHGDDTIQNGGGVDTLVIDMPRDQVSARLGDNENDNLYIQYGNNTITVEDYKLGDHSVQKVKIAGVEYTIDELLNNTIKGTANGEQLIGGAENDIIFGYGGDDHIQGSEGNDVINGGSGNNFIYFYENNGNDTIINGDGHDTLVFGVDANTYIPRSAISARLGDNEDNNLYIQYGNNTITVEDYKLGNHSVQYAQIEGKYYSIDDLINGVYHGTDETDVIIGGAGNDDIRGYGGDDHLQGSEGNDTINGGAGTNFIYFYPDHGQDTVKNGGGLDALVFNYGQIKLEDLNIYKGQGNDKNLYIEYGNGDKVTIEGYQNGSHSTQYIIVNNESYAIRDIVGENLVGTDADDFIVAGNGEDVIHGNGGDDILQGSQGNDTINGGTGTNHMYFYIGDGQDVIENGGGVDELIINDTTVTLNDINIVKGEGNNKNLYINYGENDQIIVQNYLDGNHSVQYLTVGGTTYELGELAGKTLNGTDDVDVLIGGAGDDVINGFGGDDHLQGSGGNDTINGGTGNNFIYFYANNGNDTIKNGGGVDTLVIDMPRDQISARLGDNEDNNLYIQYGNNTITVEDYKLGDHSVQYAQIGGKYYSIDDLINGIYHGTDETDVIIGGTGDDIIRGYGGDDHLQGSIGADTINGGTGTNHIYFYVGDGQDVIENGGGVDKIVFGEGISRDNLVATLGGEDDKDLYIKYGATDSDRVIIQGFKDCDYSATTISVGGQEFNVNDLIVGAKYGTVMDDVLVGGDENEDIYGGAGNDAIAGGKGNDTIDGGTGDNSLYFYTGDGLDTVKNGGGRDYIHFGDNITLANISMTYGEGDNNNLYINYGNGDMITVEDYKLGNHSVQGVVIGGTFYAINYFFDQNINGTEAGETLIGGLGNDTINGFGGDDLISGEGGSNTINGGTGNDQIYLYGTDTVELDANCGNDTIHFNNNGAQTVLKFNDVANQAALEDIVVRNSGSNYTITYGTNIITLENPNASTLWLTTADGDRVTLASWYAAHPVPTEIYSRESDIYGTAGNDIITVGDDTINPWMTHTVSAYGGNDTVYGSNQIDYVYGGAGNDTIYGAGGDDYLQGNSGDDIINGGIGNNTLVFYEGDGNDIVQNGGGADVIEIARGHVSTVSIEGRNLVIRYGNNDSITIQDAYDAQGNWTGHNVSLKTPDDGWISMAEALAKYDRGLHTKTEHTAIWGGNNPTIYLGDENPNTYTGTGTNNQIYGGQGNDVLVGGSNRDDIYGGDGNDYIIGGAGNDRLWGGAGNNTFEFNAGDGADIIYEYNADNTLRFTNIANLDEMKQKLKITSRANSLLSGGSYRGYNYTQPVLDITGYGYADDTVSLYNSGYQNYKLQAANGDTINLREFIVENCYDATNLVNENFALNEGSAFGGTVYVPTNLSQDISRRANFVSLADDYGATIYSGGNAGYSQAYITGSNGNDTIYNGLDEQGRNIFHYKVNPNDPVQDYDLGEWGYARLCYKIERDASGNPIIESTNADNSQNVKFETKIEVGGYFYSYGVTLRPNDYTDIESSESETLTQSELVNFYNQYLTEKAAGRTYKDYDFETVAWNETIDGTNRYYDSFSQYKNYYTTETYDVKVNYYKPEHPIDFQTGAMTEWFRATYNGEEVWMQISRTPEGTNFPTSQYQHYGYSISTTSNAVNGAGGNDIIYTRTDASGGAGDDTIYTMSSAEGDEGNDKLIAYKSSVQLDGGEGYDLLDFRDQDGITTNEYGTDLPRNNINMSLGVDTVLLDKNNTYMQNQIAMAITLPITNNRFIETRWTGYSALKSSYLSMGDDLVLISSNSGAGSAMIIKDYNTADFDAIRDNVKFNGTTTYYTYNAEPKDMRERYGNLGLQPSIGSNSNHQYLSYWLDTQITDGSTMYLSAASDFDYFGEQYANNFVVRTETVENQKRKYVERTRAFADHEDLSTEKGVEVQRNGNILYQNLTGYDNQGNGQYETVTILNDGQGNYYTESWDLSYDAPTGVNNQYEIEFQQQNLHFNVKYGTEYRLRSDYEFSYAQTSGLVYDDAKTVRFEYERTEYTRNGNIINRHAVGYNDYIDIYENENGKFTIKWVDGSWEKDDNGRNTVWHDGYYEYDYLAKDDDGNYILPVNIGSYSDYNNNNNGYTITVNLVITATNLAKDGNGNLQFISNVGDGTEITGSQTYTIYQNDKVYLRQDDEGNVYFDKVTGIDANGNKTYQEVKLGKVNADGNFVEIYGDNDLFNQNTYYNNPDRQAYYQQNYSALAGTYTQDDFLVGGAGSQKIFGGEGDDTIYGTNLPTYEDVNSDGNYQLNIDNAPDEIYGEKGNDYLIGGAGNDYIDGGEGADKIYGGAGDDTIVGGKGIIKNTNDTFQLVQSGDNIYGEDGNDVIYSVGKYDSTESHLKENLVEAQETTIDGAFDVSYKSYTYEYMGDKARTEVDGGNAYSRNIIDGGAGDDIIIANAWDDTVYGGDGDDTIVSYKKHDPAGDTSFSSSYENGIEIDGGAGNDKITLYGDAIYFNTNVDGGEGNDIIDARNLTLPENAPSYWTNPDYTVTSLNGGDGDDVIYGSELNDSINGGAGHDRVAGFGGHDYITVGAGLYNQGVSYAYGGEGNDTLIGGGESYLYGEAGDDTFYNYSQTGTVINPSRITMDGGAGDDKYIREGDSYGYDTIIASSGNDEIIYTTVANSDDLSAYRYGDDLVIKNKSAYGVVGGSVPFESLLTLKDYFNETNATYGDNHDQLAKTLFDNYRVTLKDGAMTRISLLLPEFINYVTGGITKITSGIGTSGNDFIEAGADVTSVYGYSGDDNILSSNATTFISGGSGNDTIQGNNNDGSRDLTQIITGDNGTASIEKINDEYNNFITYKPNYISSTDNTNDGNDDITARAGFNFVWGEGGDDNINVEYGNSMVYGGDGNDTITLVDDSEGDVIGAVVDGGAGNDTIIGGGYYVNGGSGDDVIKVQASNANYHNGDGQALFNLKERYKAQGVDVDYADSLMESLSEASTALQNAIIDRKKILFKLTNGSDGYSSVESALSNLEYYQKDVDTAQNAIDKLEPDYADWQNSYNYKRNALDNAKENLARYQKIYNDAVARVEGYEAQIATFDATIKEKQALIAEIQQEAQNLGLMDYINDYQHGHRVAYGGSIVEGGEGNDEITLGYKAAGDYNGKVSGNYYVKGGAGDDTYIIPDYYSDDDVANGYTPRMNVSAEIVDAEGNNTLLLQSQDLTSVNVGIFMNVELERNEDGSFKTDDNGEYVYRLANFTTDENNISSSPLGDGDLGFSVVIVGADKYKYNGTPFWGSSMATGIRFNENTLNHFDKIQASDGKFITAGQIYDAAKNVANWLAEHGYASVQEAAGMNSDYYNVENMNELLSYKAFGSVQWLNEDGSMDSPATEGTEGTYLSDSLTSTSASEVFDLKTGNDTVTFEGEFGDDIIQSDSYKDLNGAAKNTDTLNFREYSIKDGSLKFEVVNGTDMKFTAYGEDGTVKGSATYQNFVTDDFTSRMLVINDKDGEHRIVFEDVAKLTTEGSESYLINNGDENSTSNYITFLTNSGRVYARIDEAGKNYNYTMADENTALQYDAYRKSHYYHGEGDFVVGEKDEIVSKGETDDKYNFYFTTDTDAFITDEGGTDSLNMMGGSNTTYWKNIRSEEIRVFFDVDYQGNTGDTTHFVRYENFTQENSEHIINLLNNEHTMKGVISFKGDVETVRTDDHPRDDSSWNYTTVKINNWKNAITTQVSQWLRDNGFPSVSYVLQSGNTAAIKTLLAMYNVEYNTVAGDDYVPPRIYTDKVLDDQPTVVVSGTNSKDYVNLPDNTDNKYIVRTGNDHDEIKGSAENSFFELGEGHDVLNITGNNNIINPGAGDDIVIIKGNGADSKNTVVIDLKYSGSIYDTLRAQDTELTIDVRKEGQYSGISSSNFTFEKFGDRLVLRYYSNGGHRIYLDNYYSEDAHKGTYMLQCNDGTFAVSDLLAAYETANGPVQEGQAKIDGNGDDDTIYVPNNTKFGVEVSGYSGDDNIYGTDIENVNVKGDSGHDAIYITGNGNSIIPDSGSDYINIKGTNANSTNTVEIVEASGGGQKVIEAENTEVVINLSSSVYTDLKLARLGDRLVIMHGNHSFVNYVYDNSGTEYIHNASMVMLENYFDNDAQDKATYKLQFKSAIGEVAGADGNTISLDDFITYYNTEHNNGENAIVTVTNWTTVDFDNYEDILRPVANSTVDMIYNTQNGDDRVIGSDITRATINTGNGNDKVDIAGYGNIINGGAGNDYIIVDTDTSDDNNTNIIKFAKGDGADQVSTNKATLEFTDSVLNDFALEKEGNNLIIKYNNGADSVTVVDYFKQGANQNITLKYNKDNDTETKALDEFISGYGDIPEIKAWDIFATDGDDVIYLSEKNTTVYLGKGNDVVNISNSAGGNIIKTEREAQGSYSTSSNIAKLVLPDTKVTFEMSGSDLLIKSDDLSAPIVVKDYSLTLDINKTALVVEDSEKAYMIHCGYTKNANGSSMDLNTTYNDSNKYNHIFIYQKGEGDSGEMEYGSSNYKIYTNDKENVFNYTGGVQSSIAYGNANGLLTVNNDGLYDGREDYYIQQFSSNSGVLINAADAGYVDYLYFKYTDMADLRIFFDVALKENPPQEEPYESLTDNGIFVHTDSMSNYDALLSAVQDDWTPEHTGIVKFKGMGPEDRVLTKNYSEDENFSVADWVSQISDRVGTWLNEHNYTSVTNVLKNGTDAEKAEVIALYNQRYDDYKYTSTGENETFTLKEGANEITFAKNFGTDTINLSADVDNYYQNDTHEDYLKFTERSFDDGTLALERVADSDNANKLNTVIFKGLDANGDVEATVTYNKMLNDLATSNNDYINDGMTLNIEDANRVYNVVSRYDNYDVDLTNEAVADKNNIVFTNNSKYSYDNSVNENGFVVTSNKNHNIIYANGSARTVYNYNNGYDIVNTLSPEADDCYNISTLTTTTSVVINDAGGDDTLNFNTSTENLRLMFSVDSVGGIGDVIFTDSNHLGTVRVEGQFDIEKVTTTDYENGIDTTAWINSIRSDVQGWLTENNYASTDAVFAQNDSTDVNALIAIYNKAYDPTMSQNP